MLLAQRKWEVSGVVLSHCARNSFVVEVLKKSNRTKLRLKLPIVSRTGRAGTHLETVGGGSGGGGGGGGGGGAGGGAAGVDFSSGSLLLSLFSCSCNCLTANVKPQTVKGRINSSLYIKTSPNSACICFAIATPIAVRRLVFLFLYADL